MKTQGTKPSKRLKHAVNQAAIVKLIAVALLSSFIFKDKDPGKGKEQNSSKPLPPYRVIFLFLKRNGSSLTLHFSLFRHRNFFLNKNKFKEKKTFLSFIIKNSVLPLINNRAVETS